jgi:hypothetical protein
MKCRKGFVSNSSSSSFCIYGSIIDDDFDIDILTPKAVELLESTEDIFDGRIESCYKAMEALSVPFTYCDEEGYIAIGNSPWDMEDNETKLEFKKRTEEEIKEYFKLEKFDWHCEEYLRTNI